MGLHSQSDEWRCQQVGQKALQEAKDIYDVLGWGHKGLPSPLTQQGQVP